MPSASEKKLGEYKQTRPQQLLLFYNQRLAEGQQLAEGAKYSRSIELYDAIPKYHWGRLKREHGKYLPLLKRQFKHRSVTYNVTIAPARLLDKAGNEKEYLPGQREELVEDALRKLACEGNGVFLDDQAGVVFSLYELQKELQKMGHGYNKNQIKEALLICGASTINVASEDGRNVVVSHIFETVGLQTREDWKAHGNDTRAFVRFNSLVTKGIKSLTFRQINYEKCMAYKSALARWFHKRLSHNYIQASALNKYTITLQTIIRDSGVKRYVRLSDNLREVRKALDEMQAAKVLSSYKVENIYGERRNKIVDAKFTLTPHREFSIEMRFHNKRYAEIQKSGAIGGTGSSK